MGNEYIRGNLVLISSYVLVLSIGICVGRIREESPRWISISGDTKALRLTGRWRVVFSGGATVHVDGLDNLVPIPEGQTFKFFSE